VAAGAMRMTHQLDLIATPDTSDVEEYRTEREWLAVRRTALGASEAAAVLGVSPYKGPMSLFAEKLELGEPEARTEAQEWGLVMEPKMAERYVRDTGHVLRDPGRYTLRRSGAVPWMVATLDREIVQADGQSVPAVLEMKLRSYVKPGAWEDEPPVDVLVQVQHQLAVTGWAWAAVTVLIGYHTFRRFVVPRHEAFIAKLIPAEAAFMERLRTKTPPPADGTEATRAVLRALYPRETPGLVVDLPAEAMAWDQDLLDAKAELARWGEIKHAAENKLRAALADAETGVLPNGAIYTYTAAERAGYTVAPTVVRTLRRKESKA
jgi:putative phage-type endonuclease